MSHTSHRSCKLHVVYGGSGKWHYRLVAGNGKVHATSEVYRSEFNAIRAAKNLGAELMLAVFRLDPRNMSPKLVSA